MFTFIIYLKLIFMYSIIFETRDFFIMNFYQLAPFIYKIKLSWNHFDILIIVEINDLILNFIWQYTAKTITKALLKMKNFFVVLIWSNIKTYYKAMSLKSVLSCRKDEQ